MEKKIVRKVNMGGYNMEFALRWLSGNNCPYISVTGEKWRMTKKGKRDMRYCEPYECGAIGDRFAKKFPQFQDIENFHCVPVQAVTFDDSNCRYFMGYDTMSNRVYPRNLSYVQKVYMLTDEELQQFVIAVDNAKTVEEMSAVIRRRGEQSKERKEKELHRLLAKYFNITEMDFEKIKQDFPIRLILE